MTPRLPNQAGALLALLVGTLGCGQPSGNVEDGGPAAIDGDHDAGAGAAGLGDAGSDGGPADAGSDGGLSDAGWDGGLGDAGSDGGPADAGQVDAGRSLRLAFASNRTGDYEIYLASADGTGLRQFTSTAGFDLFPAWSRDATVLYFASNRSGAFQLYAQSLDGGAAALIPTGIHAATAPAISPDGLWLAFEGRTFASAATDIYVTALAGGPVLQLTTHPANEAGPAWSPDGATLYFVSNRGGTYELFSMAPDGSGQAALTTGLDILGRPAATSGRVAFARPGVDLKSTLVVLDLATGLRTTVSAQSDAEPAFSPDGTRIAVTSSRNGNPEVLTLDAFDGGTVVRVTSEAAIDGTAAYSPVPL